jgi:hypothetical protein
MDIRALAARRDVRWGGGAAAVVLLAVVLALTLPGGGASQASSTSAPQSAGAVQQVATRWWSDAAAAQGSRIDESNPGAAANVLVPSQDAYCGMLKQTLAAGRSILPQAKAGDKALVASTKAFLAEIQSVAPPSVVDDWKTLAPTLLALVSGHELPANTSDQAKANAAAAKALAADAKTNCGLSLSR